MICATGLTLSMRPATSPVYVMAGATAGDAVKRWAAEIADLVTRHGGGNRRLAVDRTEPVPIRDSEEP